MKWKKITAVVGKHPLFNTVMELTAMIDEQAKARHGPEACAMCAGGAVSDMYAHSIGSRKSEIQDIDIFVIHDGLELLLKELGLPASPQHVGKYVDFTVCHSQWRGSKIHVVSTCDVADAIREFDLCDRLAWCDGRNCWASDNAIECLVHNTLDINCLSTPLSTAVRINRFMQRYQSTVTERAKWLLQRILGPTVADARKAVRPYCEDDNEADKVASLII